MSKRKYGLEYIQYGFIAIEHGGECLPQCVLCMKTLSNATMKPSLLKRHLVSNHAEKQGKDRSYFERLGENAKRQRLDQTGEYHQKKVGIVNALYEVSLLVTQNMKARTIAETLVLPAAKALVKNQIGDEAAAKLDSVSLSNDTVKRRIQKMSGDIAEQIIAGVKDSKFGFAIQLDESTDVAKCSQLLVNVSYIHNNIVKTELLLSQALAATTKRKDVFDVLADFFKENEPDWSMLVGCTTDGAPAVLGRKSEFQAYVKDVATNATFVHCFIHRFALCTRVLPSGLISCLNKIISASFSTPRSTGSPAEI